MKQEKETKDNLIKAAKKEFMEKGYQAASLRNICKNAGVTTGALYFFFEDKDDLFGYFVKEPLEQLKSIMEQHYQTEINDVERFLAKDHDTEEDIDAAQMVMHYIFQNYDAFDLLLTKSQGSSYEHCTDYFIDVSEKHYRILSDLMCKKNNMPRVDDYTIHCISHMQTYLYVHIMMHKLSEEEALAHIKIMVRYLIGGWYAMFQPYEK